MAKALKESKSKDSCTKKEWNEHVLSIWEDFWEDRSDENKNELIEVYFDFVKKIAYRLSEKIGWKVSPDELASYGVDGLYNAIDSFDKKRGYKFETYSSSRIKGAMLDEIRRQDIVPRSVRINNSKFEKTKQEMQNESGTNINSSEVIERMGHTEEEFTKNAKKFMPTSFSSLDNLNTFHTSGDYDPSDFHESIADGGAYFPNKRLCRTELIKLLFGANLSIIEKSILYFYYYKEMSMSEIALRVKVSESRVSQMHKKIIVKLQKVFENSENREAFFELINSIKK